MDKKTVFSERRLFSQEIYSRIVLTSTNARHEKTEVWGKRNQTNLKRSQNLEPKTKKIFEPFSTIFLQTYPK
jgi:hypothetical protein